MHRAVNTGRILNTVTAKESIKRWSVLEGSCVQRHLSSGSRDADEQGEGKDNEDKRDTDEADVAGNRPAKPAGRGRGAFSHFLRLHEALSSTDDFPAMESARFDLLSRKFPSLLRAWQRNIDKHSAAGSRGRGGKRIPDQAVRGQFDDPVEDGETGKGTTRSRALGQSHQDTRKKEVGKSSGGAKSREAWLRDWFAQVEDEGDPDEADWEDLDDDDDDEDERNGERALEFGPETWWVTDKEDLEEYKKLIARMELEEREQLDALQAKWDRMKLEAEEEGSTANLELPLIELTTEMSCEAPAGTATVDRAKPLPRRLETIIESMELPAGLDVKSSDPEYEQVVNMWQAVSRNNTMDERMKEETINIISSFIAKHRHSDALAKALGTKKNKKTTRSGRHRTR